jgi:hypothetical protein
VTANEVVLMPDAGPLITLAYADALDVFCKPGWRIEITDMVYHELTRNQTPSSGKIAAWIAKNGIQISATDTFARYEQTLRTPGTSVATKANLGELAIQESINKIALHQPTITSIIIFEDRRIARTSFFLPTHCQKISTRAFLLFLEEKGLIASASEIERRAINGGRQFSQIIFPPS